MSLLFSGIRKPKIRYRLAASWAASNPVLIDGEQGAERDTEKMKIGDGVTPWNSLPYTVADATGDVDIITGGGPTSIFGIVADGGTPGTMTFDFLISGGPP